MKLKGILLTGVAMAVAVSAAFSLAATSATTPSGPIAFGMESSSIAAQAAAGVKPDYGTFWIGPWTLTSGWGGPDGSLASMNSQGVTPALHFYYWGDDISPSCVENGCWSTLHNTQKDRAHWQVLAQQMVDHLNAGMAGKPVVVFLESEFNKGGIETYEPFDGYMADMAAFIHAGYPQAHIVLGFGNWGSQYWGNFDRAAAASDLVGIQGMRGSTRQTATQMMTLYDGLLAGVKTLETTFPGKGIMLTDIAVSSYPEPDYLQVQADVLKEVFDNLETLKSHGVQAMIYRSWKDSPTMSTANYYGEAERHWGVVHASDGSFKPAAQVWIDGVKAQRTGATLPPPPPPPAPAPVTAADGVAVQVESFLTKTAGGKQADAAAAGGSMWNLWSNGAVTQSFNASSPVDMTFRVRGTTLAGVGPHMDVYVAGAKVLSADPGTSYTDVQVPLPAGPATDVRIAFTNDAASSSEDRNLVLDQVSFAAPPPPNQPPLAALAASATGLTVTADA